MNALTLDSPRWWALATFLIPVMRGAGQGVVLGLATFGVAESFVAETQVSIGVLAGLTIVFGLLPFKWARACAIACVAVWAVGLIDWILP